MSTLEAPPLSLLDGAALFLDFDGTLVELAETPDSIRVPPQLEPLIRRLQVRLDGRLAIISGRSIADLERYVSCAGIAVSGSHGLELQLADGTRVPLYAPPSLEEVRSKVAAFADGRPALLVEEKPAGIALHYRRSPEEGARVLDFMRDLAGRSGFAVQQGKMVVELRPPGADKGDAVRALMLEPAFAGARPVFVGDDQTDEHGFQAAAALGGSGILVGPERETAATYRLESVGAVSNWLVAA